MIQNQVMAEETASAGSMTTVAGLYLHGPRPSQPGDTEPTPMIAVPEVTALAGKGLADSPERHLRAPLPDGREHNRQVSLIDEGTLIRHRARFGPFSDAVVKSQIVLSGSVNLPELLGRELVFGAGEEAVVLHLSIRRDPCEEMDLIASGLREAMRHGQQGALARVVRGGRIVLGQIVTIR
jgi:hypothetical protein